MEMFRLYYTKLTIQKGQVKIHGTLKITGEVELHVPKDFILFGKIELTAGSSLKVIAPKMLNTKGVSQIIGGDASRVSLQGGGMIGMYGTVNLPQGHYQVTSSAKKGALKIRQAIDVSASDPAAKGGSIAIARQDSITVCKGAHFKANGPAGGGSILIGGPKGGKGDMPISQYETIVESEVILEASATANGPGGEIVVFSRGLAQVYGNLTAQGGPEGGDGGYVEVTGNQRCQIAGIQVNAGSLAGGKPGQWILNNHTHHCTVHKTDCSNMDCKCLALSQSLKSILKEHKQALKAYGFAEKHLKAIEDWAESPEDSNLNSIKIFKEVYPLVKEKVELDQATVLAVLTTVLKQKQKIMEEAVDYTAKKLRSAYVKHARHWHHEGAEVKTQVAIAYKEGVRNYTKFADFKRSLKCNCPEYLDSLETQEDIYGAIIQGQLLVFCKVYCCIHVFGEQAKLKAIDSYYTEGHFKYTDCIYKPGFPLVCTLDAFKKESVNKRDYKEKTAQLKDLLLAGEIDVQQRNMTGTYYIQAVDKKVETEVTVAPKDKEERPQDEYASEEEYSGDVEDIEDQDLSYDEGDYDFYDEDFDFHEDSEGSGVGPDNELDSFPKTCCRVCLFGPQCPNDRCFCIGPMTSASGSSFIGGGKDPAGSKEQAIEDALSNGTNVTQYDKYDSVDRRLDNLEMAADALNILGAFAVGGPVGAAAMAAAIGKRTASKGVQKAVGQTAKEQVKAALKQPIKKLSKVEKSKKIEQVGDKFTRTTEIRPGHGPGQSRAHYIRWKNKDGKVIKTRKDHYDRANNFMDRKFMRGGPEGRPVHGD